MVLWRVRGEVEERRETEAERSLREIQTLSSSCLSVSAVQHLPAVRRGSQEPQPGEEAAGPHRPHQVETQHLRSRPQRQGEAGRAGEEALCREGRRPHRRVVLPLPVNLAARLIPEC